MITTMKSLKGRVSRTETKTQYLEYDVDNTPVSLL